MPLTHQQHATLAEWFKTSNALSPCPCGADDWVVTDDLVIAVPVRDGHLTMVTVHCKRCARIVQFDAEVMGLV